MLNQIRKTAVGAVTAGCLFATTLTGASAQEPVTEPVTVNGASGLVAAVVNVQDVVDNNGTIDVAVVVLNNSLNNLRALNNVLNNNDVDITLSTTSSISRMS